jgi:hypothetical protein
VQYHGGELGGGCWHEAIAAHLTQAKTTTKRRMKKKKKQRPKGPPQGRRARARSSGGLSSRSWIDYSLVLYGKYTKCGGIVFEAAKV